MNILAVFICSAKSKTAVVIYFKSSIKWKGTKAKISWVKQLKKGKEIIK